MFKLIAEMKTNSPKEIDDLASLSANILKYYNHFRVLYTIITSRIGIFLGEDPKHIPSLLEENIYENGLTYSELELAYIVHF